jgi:hypothetical protein
MNSKQKTLYLDLCESKKLFLDGRLEQNYSKQHYEKDWKDLAIALNAEGPPENSVTEWKKYVIYFLLQNILYLK